jgi:putative holliday junction resolvase
MLLENNGKLIALDLGTRRTGLAISDEKQRMSFPRDEILHTSSEGLLEKLQIIIDEEQVTGIIVGIPLDTNANESKQTVSTNEVIKKISHKFKLPIYKIDERFTTDEAKRLESPKNTPIDSNAAMILLENYLSIKERS